MKRTIIILSLLMLFTACSHHEPESGPIGEERPVMLRAMTKSTTKVDKTQTPVFMFWIEGDQEKFGSQTTYPYFISTPQANVDEYKNEPYNTGYLYPKNTVLYANGYSPSSLIVEEGEGIYPRTRLSVPTNLLGQLDITTSRGFVRGSSEHPFEADDAQTMVFEHLQSRVNFYAKLGNIPAARYFRGVTIKVDGNGVLTDRIEWSEEDRYKAVRRTSSVQASWSATDANANQMDPNETDPREIGSVYIHPGQTKISFELEVEMSQTPTFEQSETLKTTATVKFADQYGANLTLSEGDEYDITITILYDSFAFEGNKAIWEEGGKIPLPF